MVAAFPARAASVATDSRTASRSITAHAGRSSLCGVIQRLPDPPRAAWPPPDARFSALERPATGDAASRGWGTHLTALSSVATQHQGDSLLRLAMHAPQPRSLIHAPIAGRSYSARPPATRARTPTVTSSARPDHTEALHPAHIAPRRGQLAGPAAVRSTAAAGPAAPAGRQHRNQLGGSQRMAGPLRRPAV